MTKAEIVNDISNRLGLSKTQVMDTIDTYIDVTKESMSKGKNIYMRGFGTFLIKKRAKKKGRNISENRVVIIPEHFIPSFKPSKDFVNIIKKNSDRFKK